MPTATSARPRQLTIRDALDYVPGVFVQARWGAASGCAPVDPRRGPVTSYGLRASSSTGRRPDEHGGRQPTSRIDPSAYRLSRSIKGGNALSFGANALRGAINFVTPQAAAPPANIVQVGRRLRQLGYVSNAVPVLAARTARPTFSSPAPLAFRRQRDHSERPTPNSSRQYRLPVLGNVETRFYFDAASTRQNMPGEIHPAHGSQPSEARQHDPRRQRVDCNVDSRAHRQQDDVQARRHHNG